MSTPSLPVPEALIFQPTSLQEDVSKCFDNIPRYLFRLYAPKTAGTTSTSNVTSPAWNCGKTEKKRDLFQLPLGEAADLLYQHLKWITSHQLECNLMSWTSSLLVAIQYGLYRHFKDFDDSELSSIFLLVVDTRDFPRGTFIKDLEVIEAFKGYSDRLGNMHRLRTGGTYYFGEYLTQGHLHIEDRCSQTSIQQMVDLGLFDLYPELEDREYWDKWASRVVELRSVFQRPCSATEHSDVRKAITIAQGCFGDRWAFPVAAMLLSLKHRQQDDPAILNGFRAMFTDAEIGKLSLEDIKIDSRRCPEIEQYENMIRDLNRHFKEAGTRVLVDPFKRLRLDEGEGEREDEKEGEKEKGETEGEKEKGEKEKGEKEGDKE